MHWFVKIKFICTCCKITKKLAADSLFYLFLKLVHISLISLRNAHILNMYSIHPRENMMEGAMKISTCTVYTIERIGYKSVQ